MNWPCLGVAALALVLAGGAQANTPQSSPRPVLRPGPAVAVPQALMRSGALAARVALRPRLRPGAGFASAASAASSVAIIPISKVGRLCRDRAIRGEVLRPIQNGPTCAIAAPIRVHRVAGVALSPPAIMTCETAAALKGWLEDGVTPAVGRLGRGLARLDISASFSCAAAPELSDRVAETHRVGTALDVRALTLKNGVSIDVAAGWGDPVAGQVLRRAHAAACDRFHTVLGPDAGTAYRDRFHLDTGPRRGRKLCR